jgi:hypothetical protein
MVNNDVIDLVSNKEQSITAAITAMQTVNPELLQVILIRK